MECLRDDNQTRDVQSMKTSANPIFLSFWYLPLRGVTQLQPLCLLTNVTAFSLLFIFTVTYWVLLISFPL